MGTRRVLVVALSLMLATSGCRWIVRASVDSAGNQGNDHSLGEVALSADGRFLAFESDASNLVPNDTNGDRDVFVRDNQSGDVVRAFDGARLVDITEDGRYVAAADTAPCQELGTLAGLFIYDRQTGTTECAGGLSVSSWALSATGQYVAGASPQVDAVFVLERDTGQIETIPIPTGRLFSGGLGLSDDGRHVVFEAEIPPRLCGPPPNPVCPAVPHVFAHDRQTDTTESLPLPPPNPYMRPIR